MNFKRLNSDLLDLIEMRNELADTPFQDERYDDLEEEIHDFEDEFLDRYGDFLDSIIERIHDSIAPDIDPLVGTAYLARKYYQDPENEDLFEVDPDAGILLETVLKNAKGKPMDARMVIMPSPFRFDLIIQGEIRTLWSSEDENTFHLD